jgi:hypothetical protein
VFLELLFVCGWNQPMCKRVEHAAAALRGAAIGTKLPQSKKAR